MWWAEIGDAPPAAEKPSEHPDSCRRSVTMVVADSGVAPAEAADAAVVAGDVDEVTHGASDSGSRWCP